jgi:hypothetical protein
MEACVTDLVHAFVDGKVQRRFAMLCQALNTFFGNGTKTIEGVYVEYKIFQKKAFATVKGSEVKEYVRRDLEGAKKGLMAYNLLHNVLDNEIAMLSSNFGLRSYLKDALGESKVTPELVDEMQGELGVYWALTYGGMLDNWKELQKKFVDLRKLLKEQIDVMEKLEYTYYYEALDENRNIESLFLEERRVFYDAMQVYVKTQNRLYTDTAAKFQTAVQQAYQTLVILRRRLNDSFDRDLVLAKTNAQKAVIAVIYLAGAFWILKDTKEKVKDLVIGRGATWAVMPLFRRIFKGNEAVLGIVIGKIKDRSQDVEIIACGSTDVPLLTRSIDNLSPALRLA